MPVNARLHASEVGYIIDNSEAAAIAYDEGLAGQVMGWLEGLPRLSGQAVKTWSKGLEHKD